MISLSADYQWCFAKIIKRLPNGKTLWEPKSEPFIATPMIAKLKDAKLKSKGSNLDTVLINLTLINKEKQNDLLR